MRPTIILNFLLFVLGLLPLTAISSTYKINEIAYLSINSAITPATYDYLQYQFQNISDESLAVIKINTPGGLVTTTKDIITLIGEQKFPVAVWITPEGASASSAGAIIASAAHFIFMSPGTNIGAATPVGLNEDTKGDSRNKALNDLTALVRSLSDSRGRPSAPFEAMIKTAESYTDQEALKLGIIEGIISRPHELKKDIAGESIVLNGEKRTIVFAEAPATREFEPTAGQKILEVLADPSTAYFLFLIGIALIYFEFQAPGGFIAGAVGLGFIILAAISFQVLPLNWGALGLIVLGLFLFVLEIFITSFGILSIAGLTSMVMGSLFLFHGETGFISVDYPVMLSSLAGVLVSMGFIVWYLYNDYKKQKTNPNFFLPLGSTGIIVNKRPLLKTFQVKVKGEIWNATSPDDLQVGESVEVTGVDERKLLIEIRRLILKE